LRTTAAAGTLAKRLRALESKVRVNVRFCAARDLASLRQKSLGDLDHYEFFRVLRGSPGIVSGESFKSLVKREKDKNASLSELVKTFLGTRR
jgi:hypothetical protein